MAHEEKAVFAAGLCAGIATWCVATEEYGLAVANILMFIVCLMLYKGRGARQTVTGGTA